MDSLCLQMGSTMGDRRSIFIGKKPLHAYVRAVVMAMEEGDRELQLVARGATIGRAVDVAEICRRRNGIIAQGLPEEVVIGNISCTSEIFKQDDNRDRTVSVLTIELDGVGELPLEEE
ncbi:MAG: DNA-binding protein [Candidatus Poseidoniales archaeon]|uniref:DNA/RNA binding protein Alba n=1 Tax=uncultured archaeon MedDCM-OCT-S05-C32 TaxID=743090 RepID=D6PBJ0_9ARCH|nr:DNA/RNA binding protein Alba [uncultured archaeon MedDCM-OCT-S05-C32]MAI40218.1 DNA-binding protein [Euryarchaeota archaeon]MAM36334.1 DNA-binding protein [Euryarchaeota archaeon]RJU89539.1 MAG: DNA-binding protein [Candidatus Poseidoniales archaeon]